MSNSRHSHPPAGAEPILLLDNVTHCYGDTVAVDGVTLAVGAGEVFGLLGHNGAGKTTTVRLLNGLMAPTHGAMRILGLDPAREGPAVRRQTGVLTESPALDERLSARDNLALFGRMYGMSRRHARSAADELLAVVGLGERAGEPAGAFSRGMKQRVALARALLNEPRVLFLDEPSSGLDPVAIRHLHTLIRELSRDQGVTIILCTHNLAEAQALCDRVAVLQAGRVMAQGSPAELARALPQAMALRLEIPVLDHARAVRALDATGMPLRSETDGAFLILHGAGKEDAPAILRTLVAHDVPVYQLRFDEPALEDVYFALHARDGAAPVEPEEVWA